MKIKLPKQLNTYIVSLNSYRFNRVQVFGLILMLLMPLSAMAEKKDHPLISRYPETTIHSAWVDEYTEYNMPTAAYQERRVLAGKITKSGKVTHILYKGDASISGLRAHENYLSSLKKEGFDIFFSCKNKECGDGKFIDDLHGGPHKMMWVNENGKNSDADSYFSVISATKSLAQKTYYVVLYFNNRYSKGGFKLLQDVLEVEGVGDGLVEVSLDFDQVRLQGKMVLGGLYFDTGKSELLDKSQESLGLISAFLKKNTDRKFLVVGHTDSDGDYSQNLTLSQKRASAVKESLVSDYGVGLLQLKAVGVSSASPLKSNNTPTGKAGNRRVELVEY